MPERTHLTIYGATGFTAKAIIAELFSGGPKRWPPIFKWSIAGRNRVALQELRTALSRKENSHVPIPDIVVADVNDQESLNTMASQTRLLLNCVGPYRDYGEPVVKACLHAHTDYIDLCGEPAFIEKMHFLYHKLATDAGVFVCHAVAFDSVPCDLGVVLCKKLLAERGARPSSLEMFLTVQATGKPAVNFATYEAAIKGFSATAELRDLRKKLSSIRPKPVPIGPPLSMSNSGANSGVIARAGVTRDPRRSGWLVPYFFSDPAVVRLSQSLALYMASGNPSSDDTPVHFAAHIEILTLWGIFLFVFHFIVFQFLAMRQWGRHFLYRYPGLFTMGIVRKGGIVQEDLRDTSFVQSFYAKGYSPSAATADQIGNPDVSLTLKIRGPEPGYIATPIIALEVARLVLYKREEMKVGVLTPAVAFGHLDRPELNTAEGEGGVMNALQRDGRIMWSLTDVEVINYYVHASAKSKL